MKSKISMLALIGIIGFAQPLYAQETDETSIEKVQQQTKDFLETIGSYTADKKDEAVNLARQSLESIDERIAELQANLDENYEEMSKEAREQSRESVQALREQRIKVAEWYGSMKASSSNSWDHMKEGFSDAYKDLAKAWEESEKEFGADK